MANLYVASIPFYALNMSLSPSVSLSAEQLREKFLQCHICFEDYDEDLQHPRLLPCLHTFCYKCVMKIYKDGTIECPECRISHKVHYDDFRDIPKDNTRRDLMDFVRIQRAPTTVMCQVCDGDTNKASFRCKQCAEFLCEECKDAHKRTRVTREHELLSLEELKTKQTLEAFCHPQECKDHEGKHLDLYCSKAECQKPICINCALVTHKEVNNHKIDSAKDVCNNKKEKIGKLMEKLDETGLKVTGVIRTVDQEIANVSEKGREVECEVDAAFDSFIKMLEMRREEMKTTVADHVTSKTKILETQLASMKDHKKRIEDSLHFSEQSLAYTNPSAFLQIEKTIVTRLNGLQRQEFDISPHELASFGFICSGMLTEIQEVALRMSNVWSTSIYPPMTEIDTQGQGTEKEVMTFYVTLKNFKGQQTDDGVGKLAAIVKRQDDNNKEIAIDARVDNPSKATEGRFRIAFVPFVHGKHTLEIRALSTVIGKKEFEVQEALEDTVSKVDDLVIKAAKLTEFSFNEKRAHKDVTVSPDGKTFLNSPTRVDAASFKNALQKYKGAMGNKPLTGPGSHYYEINVRYTIRRPLEKCNLVFEIGLARESSIDNRIHVDGQPFAWSLIGAHHNDCDAICLHIAHNGQCVFHDMLSANEPDATMTRTFGFLLDTDKKELKVYNGLEGSQICLIDDVDCSEPLYPVVAGYNPYQVEVTMNLRTGKFPRDN